MRNKQPNDDLDGFEPYKKVLFLPNDSPDMFAQQTTHSGCRVTRSSVTCDISPFKTTPHVQTELAPAEKSFESLIGDFDMDEAEAQCSNGLRAKREGEAIVSSCTASSDDSQMSDLTS